MVLLNLSKFLRLVVEVQACPESFPKRKELMFEAYNSFTPSSDHIISVSVSTNLERRVEENVDNETEERKKQIIEAIVGMYTKNKFQAQLSGKKSYLMSEKEVCEECENSSLVPVKPRSGGRISVLYSLSGESEAEVFNKHCPVCSCTVTPCYTDFSRRGIICRKYSQNSTKLFSVTSESFFEVSFLDMVTEDVFTCKSSISDIVEKYNRVSVQNIALDKRRLFAAWIVYHIIKRLGQIEFPVVRDDFRGFDLDATCENLYSKLREHVDNKWLGHKCTRCSSRILIMDGAAKIYRTVCAAKPEKVTRRGDLNEFNVCIRSPLPGKTLCATHQNENSGDSGIRLDSEISRRETRQALGLETDVLTTEEGCRKRTAITVRTKRNKTAGMLYAIRPCGIIVGHMECIHAEEITTFF